MITGICCFLLISEYLHNKEVDGLISKCEGNGGESTLTIHNRLTNSYTFNCEK
ncbi:hypothetical protein KH172YL63_21130 [Bacillus sp. KH172YL63]|nr:hypothetical protein KH172YL63_21130 [Bacillus sp. KH172YL63]